MLQIVRNTGGKEIKEKGRSLKLAMRNKSPTKCLQTILLSCHMWVVSVKDLTVKI